MADNTDKYHQISDTVQRITFSLIPVIGSVIKESLIDHWARKDQSRINSLVGELENQVKSINNNLIDKKYLESDDFYDFIVSALNNARKTSLQDKHLAYAKLLRQVITKKSRFEYDEESLFLKYISELTPQHISLLYFFYTEIAQDSQVFRNIESFENLYQKFSLWLTESQVDKYLFKKWCVNLENRALINYGDNLEDYNHTIEVSTFSSSQSNSLIVTEIGGRFAHFINHFDDKKYFEST